MKSSSVRDGLQRIGLTPVATERMAPAYLGKFVQSEIQKWVASIKASGLSRD